MNTQFWKGFLMCIVGVIFTTFNTIPINFSIMLVTLIGSILVYIGTNAIKSLRPISIPSTLTWRDAVHSLFILIGNGLVDSAYSIVTGTTIHWIILLQISASIAFTYLGSTFFGGPYSAKPVSWSKKTRISYTKKMMIL
jgi:hypothetical protein